jgi:hypothetical protein
MLVEIQGVGFVDLSKVVMVVPTKTDDGGEGIRVWFENIEFSKYDPAFTYSGKAAEEFLANLRFWGYTPVGFDKVIKLPIYICSTHPSSIELRDYMRQAKGIKNQSSPPSSSE